MTVLLKYITQEAAASGDDKAVAGKREEHAGALPADSARVLEGKTCASTCSRVFFADALSLFELPERATSQVVHGPLRFGDRRRRGLPQLERDVTDAYPGKGQALFQVKFHPKIRKSSIGFCINFFNCLLDR
jgi:hypothetical protein